MYQKETFGSQNGPEDKLPSGQTVPPALHVAVSCSVSSGGLFIADLYVMYHICRYFILCTLTRHQRTFFSFDLRGHLVYILFQYRAAGLRLQKSDTTPLCVCLRLCVCGWYMCMLTPRPFVVCTTTDVVPNHPLIPKIHHFILLIWVTYSPTLPAPFTFFQTVPKHQNFSGLRIAVQFQQSRISRP